MKRSAEETEKESALQVLLMTYLAQGIISGVMVHSIAQAAAKDLEASREGFSLPALDRLAHLKHGRNLVQQVHSTLRRSTDLPEPFTCEIPYKDGLHPGSMLLPHELLAAFFQKPHFWKKAVLPDQMKLKAFWDAFEEHPAMTGHPCRRKANYKSKGIPIGLHGDEVPVVGVGKIWSRSCLSFSWCSLIANACGERCEDIMFYLWSAFERFLVPTTTTAMGTLDTFFKILQWSFQIIFDGVWPHHDWAGQRYHAKSPEGLRAGKPLCGGYFGILLQLSGDLDYFNKHLGLPSSTTHHKPCGLCRAQFGGPNSWLDNRVNSGWQQQMLTATNWQTWWTTACPLFQAPGLSAMSVAYDLMHCSFLGWHQYLYGSILWLLTHQLLDLEPLANLKTVWEFIKNVQKGDQRRHPYRHRLDKMTMFTRKKGFPKLKGRAADIQGLDLALKLCWEQFMDPNQLQHVRILALLTLNVEIGELLDTYSPKYNHMSVPLEPWNRLVSKGFQMAQLHLQLSEHYKEQDLSLFNITTKTHFCLHVYLLARHIHPSITWCYKGEHMMKLSQKLFKSCLSGNKHWNVGRVATLKFRHLLHLKLRNE